MVMQPEAETGLSVVVGYDLLGRVGSVGTVDAPDRFVSYQYDSSSLVTSEVLADGAVERRFTHTPLGEFFECDDPFFTNAVSYRRGGDPDGSYMDGSVTRESFTFKPDRFSRLASKPQSHRYDYTYDDFGRLTEARAHAGATARSDWDVTVGAGGSGVGQGAYTADEGIVSLRRGGVEQRYEYEEGRHRLSKVTGGSTSGSFTYTADGSLVAAPERGLATIEYDASDGSSRQITTTGGSTTRYRRFDGGHQASRRRDDDPATLFFGGGPEPLVSADDADRETRYVYAGGRLVAIERDGEWLFVVSDRLGSSRVVVGGDGHARGFFNYGPFGTMLAGNADDGTVGWFDKRYTGQTWNADQQLYDYHARHYDPTLGRFLQVDPKLETADPYAYVANNPIMHTDPTGMGLLDSLTQGWSSSETWESTWATGGRLYRAAAVGKLGLAGANEVAAVGIKNLSPVEQFLLPLKYGFKPGFTRFWGSAYGLSTIIRFLKWAGTFAVSTVAGWRLTGSSATGLKMGALAFGITVLQDLVYQRIARKYLITASRRIWKYVQAMTYPHWLSYGALGLGRDIAQWFIVRDHMQHRTSETPKEIRPFGYVFLVWAIQYVAVLGMYSLRSVVKYNAKANWSTTTRKSARILIEKAAPGLTVNKNTTYPKGLTLMAPNGAPVPAVPGVNHFNPAGTGQHYYFPTPATPPDYRFAIGKLGLRTLTECAVLGAKGGALHLLAGLGKS